MKNRGYIIGKESEEIKMLAYKAVSANNKKSAKYFINRLDFMQRTLDIYLYKRNVFAELVSYVIAASRQVRDKEHWIDAVNQNLLKLEPFSEDIGGMK